jgi:4-amino-4-deoxy-L-arabinose transferase-like glycosyltransferase
MIFSDLPSPAEAGFAKAGNRFPPRIKSGAGFFGIMLFFGSRAMTTTNSNDERIHWPAKGLTAVVDFAVASHARAVAILIAVALAAFLPGFFQLPPIDRDEARFAQATKQMVESDDYVDIRFQDEVRYKKPVGIYWLQAAVVKSADMLGLPHARSTIWLYRVPSLLGALGAVVLTYWTALAFVSRRAALLAGLMLATSILLGVEARLAKTDAVLLATVLAAMGALARVYLGARGVRPLARGWGLPAIFWTALAAGILLKGPLILMIVVLTAGTLALLDRSTRWLLALRPLPGLAWLIVLVLPWFLAIVVRSGDSFFAESLGQDLLGKVASGQESHGAPPGFYFALFWVTFWPGATLAAMATPSVWAARREPGARFLLAWLIPSWIVFELVMTKLPHYVLPLYPAIAILIAGVIDPHALARQRWLVRGTGWWLGLPLIIAIAGIVGLVAIGRQLGLLAWPFAAGAVIFGLIAWRLYDVDGPERSLLRAMAASLLIAIAIYAVIAPSLTALFPSVTLAQTLRASDCKQPLAAAAGFHEPSLVFLVGTPTRLTDGAGAAEFLRQGSCRFAFIEARQERSFVQRAEAIGLRYAPGPRIDGINSSIGRAISIAVYRSEGIP